MHVVWKFTGDGILALVGGALALFGVWLSNRQSIRNVQRQLDAEKQARKDEQDIQKRALAKALLFEIDHFYRSYLSTTLALAQRTQGRDMDSMTAHALSVAMHIEPAPFDIYEKNTDRLGNLGLETATSVIRFYKIAADLKDHVRRYLECLSGGRLTTPFPAPIENVVLNLRIGALETCGWLCLAAGLPFDSTDIAVSHEVIQIKELASSRQVPINRPSGIGEAKC